MLSGPLSMTPVSVSFYNTPPLRLYLVLSLSVSVSLCFCLSTHAMKALQEVHVLIESDKRTSPNGDIAGRFEASLNIVVARGEKLFTPLLQRRRAAERDRNALSVLTSYKFLFNLPQR